MAWLGLAGPLVPRDAFVFVILVIHRGQFLRPARFGQGDQLGPRLAALVACASSKIVQKLFSNTFCIALDGDVDFLGEANAVRVDVDLDDLCILGPVVDAIAGQRAERVQTVAKGQNDVGLLDDLHRGF